MRSVCKSLLLIIILCTTCFAKDSISSGVSMRADEVSYDANKDTVTATGDIFIQIKDYTLNAEKVYFDLDNDVIFAEGSVRVMDQDGRVIYGEKAVFKDQLRQGVIEEFIVRFDGNSILTARLAKRLGKNRVTLEKTVFTPCSMNCGKKPIWQLSAGHTDIDYDKQKIAYKHLFFELYGVPIMYFPYFAHATPGATAQSGLLGPKIKQDDLLIPFYFRLKPNLDVTISPRLSKNYTITEGELRYKVKYGEYNIKGSYGNPSFRKQSTEKVQENSRPARYHVFASGDFSKDNINYGFDINRASDKAYLTNYHEIYSSYLASKIYINTVNKRDYFSLEGYYFQDLRADESKLETPFILPAIRTQNTYDLRGDESILLNVRNNAIAYREPRGRQFAREALDLELMTNLISDGGHMFNITLANRADIYLVGLSDQAKENERERIWHRNIPELRTRWRYPLVRRISSKSNIKIEPTAMIVFGRKFEPRFNKFEMIDAPKNELSENNIFSANRFSGVDIHDYGNRLSYGINSSLMSDRLYIDAFLGQLVHKNNVVDNGNSEYVGSVSIDIANSVDVFYRFRRDEKLKPIRNEVGVVAETDGFNAKALFTELHNVSKHFAKIGFEPEENKASQLSVDANYRLTKNLWVGGGAKLNTASKRARVLTRTIRVTYLYDCVTISGAITDNFLHDSLRGIKKGRSKSFSVGLKVINM